MSSNFFSSKIQNLGLSKDYGKDKTLYNESRRLMALAFVCYRNIPAAYSEIKENVSGKGKPLFEWFFKNYIGDDENRPRFSPKKWSVANLMDKNLPRTTNSLESWHRTMNSIIDVNHPTVLRPNCISK